MRVEEKDRGGTGEHYYPALDEAVAVYLRRHGMTQEEFARDVMGMATNTFSWKRRGVREFTMSEVITLSDALGLSLTELIGIAA